VTPPGHPPHEALGDGGVADVGGVVGHQTRDLDYTRLTGGPISTEVLEAAGAAGVSDTDPARYMCIVDESNAEESAKRANPSSAVVQPMRVIEQAEKRLKANSKLSDDELNSKLKRLRESALNARAIFKFDPSDQATSRRWGGTSAIQALPRGQHP
jgi:hypothetical protein